MNKKISVLIVDDDGDYLKDMKLLLSDVFSVYTVKHPELAIEILNSEKIDIILLDIELHSDISGIDWITKIKNINNDIPIIMVSYHSEVDYVASAMRNGAIDYINKLGTIENFIRTIKSSIKKYHIRKIVKEEYEPVYVSNEMKKVMQLVNNVALTDISVTLLGESGVGKTLLAEYIHKISNRKESPFTVINIPSINENLFESELFGHKKGAFTGAVENKIGKIEAAQNGTVFFDEISECSPVIQAKLLRLFERKEFEKVGENKTVKADVRFITATNKNLEEEVKNGNFRKDLYYRVNSFSIQIPSLRERTEDIVYLSEYFLDKIGSEILKKRVVLNEEAKTALINYSWPGNVRELFSVLEKLSVLINGRKIITESDIRNVIEIKNPDNNEYAKSFNLFIEENLKKLKFSYFFYMLKQFNWNISKTAKASGISRQSLYRYLDELGIGK